MAEKNTALQLAQKTQENVLAKVKAFEEKGELVFPKNYVPENALKSAWLKIQETEDRNKKLAIDVCTQVSIANALLSTVVQGLNPDKSQCYYIVYGNKLTLSRSYFGSECVAKRVNENIIDFPAQPIYEGDEIVYIIKDAKKYVTSHKQKFQNVKKEKIIGAYCTVRQKDGDNYSVIMNIDEIYDSWKKSPTHPFDDNGNLKPNSTHAKHPAEMACRTVISKTCKHIINSSDDHNLIVKFAKANDEDIAKAIAEQEIEEKSNKGDVVDAVDVDYKDVPDGVDPETGEVKEQEKLEAAPQSPTVGDGNHDEDF